MINRAPGRSTKMSPRLISASRRHVRLRLGPDADHVSAVLTGPPLTNAVPSSRSARTSTVTPSSTSISSSPDADVHVDVLGASSGTPTTWRDLISRHAIETSRPGEPPADRPARRCCPRRLLDAGPSGVPATNPAAGEGGRGASATWPVRATLTKTPAPQTTAAAPSHCSGCSRPPFAWSIKRPMAATSRATPSAMRRAPTAGGGAGGHRRGRPRPPVVRGGHGHRRERPSRVRGCHSAMASPTSRRSIHGPAKRSWSRRAEARHRAEHGEAHRPASVRPGGGRRRGAATARRRPRRRARRRAPGHEADRGPQRVDAEAAADHEADAAEDRLRPPPAAGRGGTVRDPAPPVGRWAARVNMGTSDRTNTLRRAPSGMTLNLIPPRTPVRAITDVGPGHVARRWPGEPGLVTRLAAASCAAGTASSPAWPAGAPTTGASSRRSCGPPSACSRWPVASAPCCTAAGVVDPEPRRPAPAAPGPPRRPPPAGHRRRGDASLLVARTVGLWPGDAIMIPATIVATAIVVVWSRATIARRVGWAGRGVRSPPGRPARCRCRLAGRAHRRASATSGVGGAIAVGLGGLAMIAAPALGRLLRSLDEERVMRIREDERARRRPPPRLGAAVAGADPAQPTTRGGWPSLARRQERELRAWLYGDRPIGDPTSLQAAIDAMAAGVEADHDIRVEAVSSATSRSTRPPGPPRRLREATTNAARHADVDQVDVFVEVDDGELTRLRPRHRARVRPGAVPPTAGASATRSSAGPSASVARATVIVSRAPAPRSSCASRGGRRDRPHRPRRRPRPVPRRRAGRADRAGRASRSSARRRRRRGGRRHPRHPPDVVLLDVHLPGGGGEPVIDGAAQRPARPASSPCRCPTPPRT